MSFDPVAALLAYHKAIDGFDIDQVASMLAEDAVYTSGGLGMVNGKADIILAMRRYFTGHPDHQSWDDDVMKSGPLAARSLWKLTATDRLTGAVVKRSGTEDIVFDNKGLISSVNVVDEAI